MIARYLLKYMVFKKPLFLVSGYPTASLDGQLVLIPREIRGELYMGYKSIWFSRVLIVERYLLLLLAL